MSCNLTFINNPQQQTEWCWAAVATNVDGFYRGGTPSMSQGQLANAELGQTTCTTNGGSSACNRPWNLAQALARLNRFSYPFIGAAPLAQCTTEICTNGRPICVRVQWQGSFSSGDGHFVAVSGVDDNQTLTVQDPWYGTNYTAYSDLVSGYQGSGTWTNTYFTKK